jgi:TonB family protein
MFTNLENRNRGRRGSLLASGLLHCLVVYFWITRPPMYVKTWSLAWGQHGKSANLIYFPRANETQPDQRKPRFELKAKRKKSQAPIPPTAEAARAGAPTGSAFDGPAMGTEAKPAIPLVFPDPPVYGWHLPKGLQGDVIVEVTIDEQGKVTETRLLQSLVRDIDDKVIAAVRTWRFKPATVDGVAISSRQDVHFHFPS